MGGVYLTGLVDWIAGAGLEVAGCDGWQSRANNGGGFDPGRPWVVCWHHDASATDSDPADVLAYELTGADAAPICNVHLWRDGTVTVLAAGKTNTEGKGGPLATRLGVIPLDSANSYAVGLELSNNGAGEPWAEHLVDAAFTLSRAITDGLGLEPDDVITHAEWTTRKIDPAQAEAVEGRWRPSSTSGAGTWSAADLRAEARARASTPPPPHRRDTLMPAYFRQGTTAYAIGDGGAIRPASGPEVFKAAGYGTIEEVPELDDAEVAAVRAANPQ